MRILIGIILIPFSASFTVTLFYSLDRWDVFEKNQFLFAAGFLSYIVIHILFYKPIFTYVISHEMSHAIWAWVLGREVKEIKASKQRGYVSTTGNVNFFLLLVPYFFPFYSIIIMLIMLIVKKQIFPYLVFLLGASIAFHLVLTLIMILKEQSDFSEAGYFFSISFVYFMNILVFLIVLSIISPSIDLGFILNTFLSNLKQILFKIKT